MFGVTTWTKRESTQANHSSSFFAAAEPGRGRAPRPRRPAFFIRVSISRMMTALSLICSPSTIWVGSVVVGGTGIRGMRGMNEGY